MIITKIVQTPKANNYIKPQTKTKNIFSQAFDRVEFRGNNSNSQSPTRGTYEWALSWDKQIRREELDQQYKKSIKAMSIWKRCFTDAPEDLLIENRKTLEREETMVTTLLQNFTRLQGLKNDADAQIKQNTADKAKLDARAEKVKKWEQASSIVEAFKIQDTGTLDDNIAGYDAEKQILRSIFIDQVVMEKAGLEAEIPNSILLYGAIGTGKSTFARAVAKESDSELIEMNPDPSDFADSVSDELKQARTRYLETGRRTIILLNEIDIHLEDTKTNYKNIARMKNWLDNCAKIPTDNLQNAFATTFLFTSNHPNNITDEILLREEKLGKVIALEPAAEDNIKEIIKFYIQKFDEYGTMIDSDSLDYDSIIKKMNPDNEKGAFGNDKIKKIVELACNDFNKDIDNIRTFEEYLNERIDRAKRNIKPERLQEYKEQLEAFREE